jgi:cytochrome c oxidase subunit I
MKMDTVSQPSSGGFTIILDYLTTVDHKKIGILYLIASGFFFLIGVFEVILMRIQLTVPNNDFISASLYNELLTMHGTTNIFLAAMPFLFGL